MTASAVLSAIQAKLGARGDLPNRDDRSYMMSPSEVRAGRGWCSNTIFALRTAVWFDD